ncbi:MAG: PmoA family protein [bacterium]|nr:PmoA family protein [bacterium]
MYFGNASRWGLLGLLACITSSVGTRAAAQHSIEQEKAAFSAEQHDGGITIFDGSTPVLSYQSAVRSRDGRWPRANYVHPLYGLDGQVLTEDFPEDHGHHRGIFWAWHQVWVNDVAAGDPWVCEDFRWDVVQMNSQLDSTQALISAQVLWRSPKILDEQGDQPAIVREDLRVQVHPRIADTRNVDFEITLNALLSGIRIGGSDDEKGYGGFSPRLKLADDLVFSGSSGNVEPTTTAVAAGPWLNIANTEMGFAILCHPDNPGYPQPWILRRGRSMQNAVYPGREPVSLPVGVPLRLKYRVVLHRGQLQSEDLTRMHEQYAH